ncbi:MAG: sigma-70 family RNA polymerase sigma factor [Pirellulales bacterium]|nr:sigma-70 family RNA polymerase sigma factor [Pirellulales bacterium]
MNGNESKNSKDRPGPELLGELIDRHGAALELFAAGWCDCPEDVVQEVLIELATRRSVPDPIVPWLYRAVRNRSTNAYRAGRRRRRYEDEAARRRPAQLSGPSGEMLDAQSATAALAGLPDKLRQPLVARLWGGLNFREIGELTGTSESTAHRRYQDALRQIRQTVMRESCTNENEI